MGADLSAKGSSSANSIESNPLGLLEVNSFYGRFSVFLDHLVAEGLVHEHHWAVLQIGESPTQLLQALVEWQPTVAPKRVDRQPN